MSVEIHKEIYTLIDTVPSELDFLCTAYYKAMRHTLSHTIPLKPIEIGYKFLLPEG